MRILLVGLPGSGKTTQAQKISQDLKISDIKMGDILRSIATTDSAMAEELQMVMQKGELLDDQATAQIIEKRLQQDDCQQGFILDGYPRDIEQLHFFDPKFDIVFHLKISVEEAWRRLEKRGRADDTKAAITNRIKIQGDNLKPLLDYLREQTKVIDIDGEQPINKISEQIEGYLK